MCSSPSATVACSVACNACSARWPSPRRRKATPAYWPRCNACCPAAHLPTPRPNACAGCAPAMASAEHLIREPIAELAAALDPQPFVQVHRSIIVNLANLAGTRRDEASRLFLRLRGHAPELPVNRACVHLFKAM